MTAHADANRVSSPQNPAKGRVGAGGRFPFGRIAFERNGAIRACQTFAPRAARIALIAVGAAAAVAQPDIHASPAPGPLHEHFQEPHSAPNLNCSAAYQWLDIMLEAAARDVERIGARPTILSRQMAIPLTAMYDAWSAYDDTAVATLLGDKLRRPEVERIRENQETAIAYAMYRTLIDQYPHFVEFIRGEMARMGHDPDNATADITTPAGIGNTVAEVLLEHRRRDGANQYGDEIGSNGEPYSDYTMYRPVNSPNKVLDPDRWQPLPFADGKGGHFYPGFLTPHWYRVKPFALESSSQFRAPAPPQYGSEQLKREVDECIAFNATLTLEQKAIVEFMRDGPRSTGQSGHWLRFAQDVSRRDRHDLDQDVKLFFSIGNVAMDAFISAWDTKRYYDTSRPWTLVRCYYKDEVIRGWAGPGQGVKEIPADQWHPYSPDTFITPPFPSYVSGHSTVSGACAEILKRFTGSDEYGFVETREAGCLTELGFAPAAMQQVDGIAPRVGPGLTMTCTVQLPLPTFSATAEMAGISRIMGGYHIQTDNVEGLAMGRKVARYSWKKYQEYFDGTARVPL